MSTAPVFQKTVSVGDDLDYGFFYGKAPWLAAGDAIFSSTWTVSATGVTLHDGSFDQQNTVIWCLMVTPGIYVVENAVTTLSNPARVVHRSFSLRVL